MRLLRRTAEPESERKREKEQAADTEFIPRFHSRWPLIRGQPFTDSSWCVAFENFYEQEKGREDIEEQERAHFL